MASVNNDFRVKHGLVVSTTATVLGDTNSTSTNTGALLVSGGVGIGGDVNIGGKINVANTSYINGSKILTAGDLETITYTATYITNDPTSVTGLSTLAGTSTSYGTYDFGTISDVQTFNDYNTSTNTGYYSIHDASGAPGFIVYIGFNNIIDFNRVVLNINYTQNSGHTEAIDLYNYVQNQWDTYTTYSGSPGWFEFILGIIDPAPYISSGTVTLRIHHISFGNPSHRTWIDYVALESSTQGGQGPRGATGATGAIGPQGLTTTTTSTFIFSNTTNSTSTNSGAVVVYGGVGINKDVYVGGSVNIDGTVVGGGVRTTTTSTAPQNATTGDIWYHPTLDIVFRYTFDGVNTNWIDMSGPIYNFR